MNALEKYAAKRKLAAGLTGHKYALSATKNILSGARARELKALLSKGDLKYNMFTGAKLNPSEAKAMLRREQVKTYGSRAALLAALGIGGRQVGKALGRRAGKRAIKKRLAIGGVAALGAGGLAALAAKG